MLLPLVRTALVLLAIGSAGCFPQYLRCDSADDCPQPGWQCGEMGTCVSVDDKGSSGAPGSSTSGGASSTSSGGASSSGSSGVAGWVAGAALEAAVVDVAIAPSAPDTIYAAVQNRGVFRSTNGGASWEDFNNGLDPANRDVTAVDASEDRIYVATTQGVFTRTDDDAWSRHNNLTLSSGERLVMAVDSQDADRVYLGSNRANMRRYIPGGGWHNAGVIGTATTINCIDVGLGGTVVAGGDRIIISQSHGNTWQDSGLQVTNVTALVIDPTVTPATFYYVDGSSIIRAEVGFSDTTVITLTGTPQTLAMGRNGFVNARLYVGVRDADALRTFGVVATEATGATPSWSTGTVAAAQGVDALGVMAASAMNPLVVYAAQRGGLVVYRTSTGGP